jgi:glucan-binding YG repeat protein
MKNLAPELPRSYRLNLIFILLGIALLFALGTAFFATQAFADENDSSLGTTQNVILTEESDETDEGDEEPLPDPLSGWQTIEGATYYYDPSTHTPIRGLRDVEGSRYYFNENTGARETGWKSLLGSRCYFDESDGKIVRGWKQIDGARYYFQTTSGKMASGWIELDGNRYYLNEQTGQMATGWLSWNNNWYYLNENASGRMHTGWLHWDNSWYYFNESANGRMETGWFYQDGSWYYLRGNGSGRMETGWQYLSWSAGSSWFYFFGGGQMATGWQYIDHKWEFLTTVNGNWIRTGGPGRGTNYVEVDLSRQHMWYVKNGSIVVESDVVTGAPWGGRATPTGAFYIMGKQSPSVLRGPGYASPVSYWMPVTSSGVGLHDATWQSAFGGTRYRNYGSHGCINMPLDKARALYTQCSTYDSVVIHW